MNILRLATWVAASLVVGASAGAGNLTAPSAKFIDKFGVNLLNGQVNSTLETISIGGAMGLSHAISLYTNHFERSGQRGYIDRYAGGAKFTQLYGPNYIWSIMRVSDPDGSFDFRIGGSGAGAFGPLKDPRNRRVVSGANNEFLDWIKPDGTVTRFQRPPNPSPETGGRLLYTTYPNGFTIYYDYLYRVYTNTGYSLVYQYEPDTRPPDAVADANAPAGAPLYSMAEWATHNPRHVRAVNSSVCWTGNAACMQRRWPTATFTWPAGMPRTMYIGRRTFSVDTPSGTTTYEYEPYDLAKDGNVVVQGYVAGQRISPRLRKVKPAASLNSVLEYTYKNLFVYTSVAVRDDFIGVVAPPTGTFPTGMGGYATLVQDAGVVKTAKLLDQRNDYDFGQVYMHETSSQNVGALAGGVWRVITSLASTPPVTTKVDSTEAEIWFEPTARNFPTEIRYHGGVTEVPEYTSQGNLKSISANGVITRAVYAYENNCATLPKICNQATSIFDANNNETRYEYHAASGQVLRVIPPADQNGRVAEVRYDYQPLRARYYDSAGNWVEGSPIYMKVAERHCHDSNYVTPDAAATCSGGDEVVTRYFYNHNNLQLTSVTTTVPGGKTLRTCYQYDVYGNKMGETQPKGASSCS